MVIELKQNDQGIYPKIKLKGLAVAPNNSPQLIIINCSLYSLFFMRSFIFLSTILLFLPCALTLRNSKCKLLVLEGGGTKGAYQAGAFETFVKLLEPGNIQYDVVSGMFSIEL
jgi:hypothetical protein